MNINEFYKLNSELQDTIANKANECGVDIKKYLSEMEDNFVIASKKGNICTWGNDNEYDYVVYGDKEEALAELQEGEFVISEAMGVLLLNSKNIKV